MQEQAHVSGKWFKAGSQNDDEVTDYYNNWAKTYDDSVKSWNYEAPEYATRLLLKYSELEGQICDADNEFAGLICIGVMTYVEDVPDALREFARITKPGGMVIFSHRTDMVNDPKFQEDLKKIETDNIWKEVSISDPKPYLPGNKDFSDKIKVVYYAYRVA